MIQNEQKEEEKKSEQSKRSNTEMETKQNTHTKRDKYVYMLSS